MGPRVKQGTTWLPPAQAVSVRGQGKGKTTISAPVKGEEGTGVGVLMEMLEVS